ncbi:hypothetical protein HUU05_07395 [candidate division KSB1 bacterium]|nr:hypothetical protein [candidate division KSB1 bacterium]
MPHLQAQPVYPSIACPFLKEPCPQGPEVGTNCQLRVAQDFDPVAKFYQQEVIHCRLCDRDFSVAEIQHLAPQANAS